MKHYFTLKKRSHLQVQRNVLLILVGCLLISNMVLSTALFFKKERVLITPPDLKRSYWVQGNKFSPSYLEAWSLQFAHLFLDVTGSSISYQGGILLRYVVPEAYGVIQKQLLDDEKRLKKEQLSTHFHPQEIKVNAASLSAEITGDLISYVADKKIDQQRETYHLQLQNRGEKLMIQSFKLLKTSQPEEKIHD